MRMVSAAAPMRNQISVMLQHVEVIISNDALNFLLRPLLSRRNAQVDSLPLERLRLPVFWNIGNHPVANFRIASIQRPWFSRQPCLSPVDPDAKFQTMLVGVVGDKCQAVRKLFGIGMPIAYGAKPSCVDVEHIHAKISVIANHAQSNLLVDRHAAAPAVIYNQRIARILPGVRIAEHRTHPAAENISRTIGAVVKSAKKNYRTLE